MTLAKAEAKILHLKITDKDYSHDEFIRILTTRSKAQLNATFNQYNDEFGHAINKVCVLLHFYCVRIECIPLISQSLGVYNFLLLRVI